MRAQGELMYLQRRSPWDPPRRRLAAATPPRREVGAFRLADSRVP
jgi:hypothetical protein